MLKKLLKYEFIYLKKDFTRIYIAYAVNVAIVALLVLVIDSSDSSVISMLVLFGFIYYAFTTLLAFMTISHNVRRFKKNMFSHEGYLTNTLPVTPAQHVIAKVIAGAVNYVLSFIVIYIGLLIISACAGGQKAMTLIWDVASDYIGHFGLMLPLFLCLATGYLAVLLCSYLVASVSSMQGGSKSGGTLLTVLIIIGYSFLYSTISSVLYTNGVSTEGAMYFFAFFFAACAAVEFALVTNIIKNNLNLQ